MLCPTKLQQRIPLLCRGSKGKLWSTWLGVLFAGGDGENFNFAI